VFIHFGKDYKEQLANMHSGDGDITWVDNMKYLGINFDSSKCVKIDICPFLRKFYTSVNAVMAHSKSVMRMLNCACLSHSLYRF